MRASLPLLLPLLAAPLALVIACGPGMTGEPAASPETASSPEPAPSTSAPPTEPAAPEPSAKPAPAPSAVECTKDEPCSSAADAAPPPLRAGKGTDPFAHASDAAAKKAPPCTKDTLKKQLQGIVNACRKSSRSICGDLVLHTAASDAGNDNVSVDFNLGTSGNTVGFSKCVVGKINSVKWECAAPGGDIHLDLGCQL